MKPILALCAVLLAAGCSSATAPVPAGLTHASSAVRLPQTITYGGASLTYTLGAVVADSCWANGTTCFVISNYPDSGAQSPIIENVGEVVHVTPALPSRRGTRQQFFVGDSIYAQLLSSGVAELGVDDTNGTLVVHGLTAGSTTLRIKDVTTSLWGQDIPVTIN